MIHTQPTKYLIFDVETGGKTEKTSSLLSFYGIIVAENFEIIDTLSLKMRPTNGIYHIDIEALKVNKINLLEHDHEAKPIEQAAEEFKNWICRHTLNGKKLVATAQNVWFDISFIQKYFFNNDPSAWEQYFEKRSIDTASLALWLKQLNLISSDVSCSLESLVWNFGIDIPKDNLHDPKVVSEAVLEIWKKMSALIKKDNSSTNRKESAA